MLDGTPGPMSGPEWVGWVALNNLEVKEQEAAEKKAARGRRKR